MYIIKKRKGRRLREEVKIRIPVHKKKIKS